MANGLTVKRALVPLATPVEDEHSVSRDDVRSVVEPSPPPKSWEACLQSLAFPAMRDRFQDIEPAAGGTCAWLFEHPTYKRWLETPQGLLWIMGNPGVGKSTLTKYALEHGKATAPAADGEPLVISFFIHERGDQLQKTPTGLFRALLHQILSREPHSLPQLIAAFEGKCTDFGKVSGAWQWHERELLESLKCCLRLLTARRPVWIYIDALDELGGECAVNVVQTFKSILQDIRSDTSNCDRTTSSGGRPISQFRLCFSCRYYPIINKEHDVMEINLEKENGNDIATFVETQLYEVTTSDTTSSIIPKLIKEKSNGVFLWACLVVARVLKLHREGAGLKKMEVEINTIPKTLEALYQEILRGMGPDSLWLIQWVCFAARPLRLDEFQWVLSFDPECPQRSIQGCKQSKNYVKSLEGVKRQIQTLSCGLVEVISSEWENHPYVMPPLTWSDESPIPRVGHCYTTQFIHQSVKDFFLDYGLEALDKTTTTRQQAIAVANLRLTKACLHLMTMREVVEYYHTDTKRSKLWAENTDPDINTWCSVYDPELEDVRFLLVNSFPMIDYASLHWIRHAKLASSYDRSTIEGGWPFEMWTSATFIEMVNRINLLSYANGHEEDWGCGGPTVMHLSVRHGLNHVLDVLWDRSTSMMAATGSPLRIPNFGAITCTLIEEAARGNHEDILRSLISGSDNILVGLAHFPVAYDLPWQWPQSPISWAASHGNMSIAKLLCDNGLVYHPDHFSHALTIAAHKGHTSMAQFLLDQGAAHRSRTLYRAFECGNEGIVRLLLDRFLPDVLQCGLVSDLLTSSVRDGKYNVVPIVFQTLLEYSDKELRGRLLSHLSEPLHSKFTDDEATAAGQMLKQAGDIDVDSATDSEGRTPLIAAASHRNVPFLQLLLDTGADLERTSITGSTALIEAVKQKKIDNIAFLLGMGANPNHIDLEGRTPLLYAEDTTHVKLLLDAGADIEYESPSGDTALLASIGSVYDYTSRMRYLVSRGADIQSKPLVLTAVDRGWKHELRKQYVESLLDLGADIDHANSEGETALLLMVKRCQMDDIRYLASRGADMRSKPLIAMVIENKELDLPKTIEMVKLLIDLGADVDAPIKESTPFQIPLVRSLQPRLRGSRTPTGTGELTSILLKASARPGYSWKLVRLRIYDWERRQKEASSNRVSPSGG